MHEGIGKKALCPVNKVSATDYTLTEDKDETKEFSVACNSSKVHQRISHTRITSFLAAK